MRNIPSVVTRPWGEYGVLEEGPDYVLKRLTINSGHRTSYQRHQKRSEDWVVASGIAKVTINGVDIHLPPGGAFHVAAGMAHRIANPGPAPLVVIEVWRGAYFSELDIERLSDDYGRTQ